MKTYEAKHSPKRNVAAGAVVTGLSLTALLAVALQAGVAQPRAEADSAKTASRASSGTTGVSQPGFSSDAIT